MRTNLLKPSKLMIGSLILLLVSVLSINAYSYLSTQGEIAKRFAETVRLKQEQKMLSVEPDFYPNRSLVMEDTECYKLVHVEFKQAWICDDMGEVGIIISSWPPINPDGTPVTWQVSVAPGNRGFCLAPGSGCTPQKCQPYEN